MKKSNKKRQTNKKMKDKIEEMHNTKTNKWEKPRREKSFMNQKTMNEEFTNYDHREGRSHRRRDKRFAPSHKVAHHSSEHQPYDQRMQIGGRARPHRRPGRGHFFYEERSRGRNMRFQSQGMDHLKGGWHHRGYYPRRHLRNEEQTAMLLCEKQRLEKRLHHMRRRLHAVNRQLHAQVG